MSVKYKITFPETKKANDMKASYIKPYLDWFIQQYGDCDYDEGHDIIHFHYEDAGTKYQIDMYTGEHRKWVEKYDKGSLQTWVKFTDAELQFFDTMGYELTDRFMHRVKQDITDWA